MLEQHIQQLTKDQRRRNHHRVLLSSSFYPPPPMFLHCLSTCNPPSLPLSLSLSLSLSLCFFSFSSSFTLSYPLSLPLSLITLSFPPFLKSLLINKIFTHSFTSVPITTYIQKQCTCIYINVYVHVHILCTCTCILQWNLRQRTCYIKDYDTNNLNIKDKFLCPK